MVYKWLLWSSKKHHSTHSDKLSKSLDLFSADCEVIVPGDFNTVVIDNYMKPFYKNWGFTLWALRDTGCASRVVGGAVPCRVPTWVERAKNNVVLKKIEWTFRKSQFWPWICPSFLRYGRLKLLLLLLFLSNLYVIRHV